MAKIKASSQQTDLTTLKDQIPLDTPLSMQIELASVCNFHCRFCMHHDNNMMAKKGVKLGCMSMETFEKTLSGLKKFPRRLRFITLQHRGESLMNREIISMLRLLKDSGVTEKVGLYTNGTLLTDEMSDGLIDAGLDVLHISIEGLSRDEYRKVAGVDVDFEKLVGQVAYFYAHKKNTYLYVKTIDNDMTEDDRERFFSIFDEISDEMFIEQPVAAWYDAGIADKYIRGGDRYFQKTTKVGVCPRIFFALVVDFDGRVVCSHDWTDEYVLGNVHDESLPKIWNGVALKHLRDLHIRGLADTIPRCRECIQRSHCLPANNIDCLMTSDDAAR